MTLLDSNIWIAYLYTEDPDHLKAQAVFDLVEFPLVLPEYVVLEACTVLMQRAGKNTADAFIRSVASNEDVELLYSSEEFFHSVLHLFEAQTHGDLSLVDTALLLLSRSYTVHTFDRKLKTAIVRSRTEKPL